MKKSKAYCIHYNWVVISPGTLTMSDTETVRGDAEETSDTRIFFQGNETTIVSTPRLALDNLPALRTRNRHRSISVEAFEIPLFL